MAGECSVRSLGELAYLHDQQVTPADEPYAIFEHFYRSCATMATARTGFLLDGVIEVSQQATKTAAAILKMRENHRARISEYLGRAAANGHGQRVIDRPFDHPIVSVASVREWRGLSRARANQIVARFIRLSSCARSPAMRGTGPCGSSRICDYSKISRRIGHEGRNTTPNVPPPGRGGGVRCCDPPELRGASL